MTPQEREARVAELKKAPRHVKAAAGFATLLGIVILLRFFASAYAGRLPFGKAALYGLLMLAIFFMNGFSLHGRKRWGYIAVAAFAALPLLGLLAASVHLLRLIVEGAATSNIPETLVGVAALCQFVVTCILFRHLLAAETREYVWKTPAYQNASANAG